MRNEVVVLEIVNLALTLVLNCHSDRHIPLVLVVVVDVVVVRALVVVVS